MLRDLILHPLLAVALDLQAPKICWCKRNCVFAVVTLFSYVSVAFPLSRLGLVLDSVQAAVRRMQALNLPRVQPCCRKQIGTRRSSAIVRAAGIYTNMYITMLREVYLDSVVFMMQHSHRLFFIYFSCCQLLRSRLEEYHGYVLPRSRPSRNLSHTSVFRHPQRVRLVINQEHVCIATLSRSLSWLQIHRAWKMWPSCWRALPIPTGNQQCKHDPSVGS